MSEQFKKLNDRHIQFIKNQHIYFVGTAASDGLVNVSPKGMDSFRIVNPSKVLWLNLTGSGNETAAHLLDSPRMTVMFCSFDAQPLILRLYGRAKAFHERDEKWSELYAQFPSSVGARQIFELELDLVQTSCGYAVPRYELKKERPGLITWADTKGREGIKAYWQENNTLSLDGKDTKIF